MAFDQRLKQHFGGLNNRVVTGAIAAGIAAASPVIAFAQSAEPQHVAYSSPQRCASLYRTSTGREIGATLSASRYSRENVGSVGIPIHAGRDLGSRSPHELGALLVEGLRRTGVEAKCFVHYENNQNGTGVDFIINGLQLDDRGSLTVAEALNVETIKDVAAEATTTRHLVAANSRRFTP